MAGSHRPSTAPSGRERDLFRGAPGPRAGSQRLPAPQPGPGRGGSPPARPLPDPTAPAYAARPDRATARPDRAAARPRRAAPRRPSQPAPTAPRVPSGRRRRGARPGRRGARWELESGVGGCAASVGGARRRRSLAGTRQPLPPRPARAASSRPAGLGARRR